MANFGYRWTILQLSLTTSSSDTKQGVDICLTRKKSHIIRCKAGESVPTVVLPQNHRSMVCMRRIVREYSCGWATWAVKGGAIGPNVWGGADVAWDKVCVQLSQAQRGLKWVNAVRVQKCECVCAGLRPLDACRKGYNQVGRVFYATMCTLCCARMM